MNNSRAIKIITPPRLWMNLFSPSLGFRTNKITIFRSSRLTFWETNLNGPLENPGQVGPLQEQLVGVGLPGEAGYDAAVCLGHVPGSGRLDGPDRFLQVRPGQCIVPVVPGRVRWLLLLLEGAGTGHVQPAAQLLLGFRLCTGLGIDDAFVLAIYN